MSFLSKRIKSKTLSYYQHKSNFFSGEQIFYNFIKEKFKNIEFLDIGVGAGRTTSFFGKICTRYIGIDSDSEMVMLCNDKFQGKFRFYTMNGEDLSYFKSCEFNSVLFSFNGLDYCNDIGRIKVLKEVKRVLSEDGLFCFSFHNLFYLSKQYDFKLIYNPKKLLLEIYRYLFIRLKNGNKLKLIRKSFSYVYDGDEWFTVKYLYSSLDYQMTILNEIGFSIMNFFDYETGEPIGIESGFEKLKSIRWIGLICCKK
jgi:ubiquinone/menaquinone biosynthesis C-methylase UbiE